MIIEHKENALYIIKCGKCGKLFKQHKSYCKQYGDEYWFNPPLVCPSCGDSVKITHLGDEYKEIKDDKPHNDNLDNLPNSKSPHLTKPVVSSVEIKKFEEPISQNIDIAEKMNLFDTLKYVKNISQHLEETVIIKKELQATKEKLHTADEVIVNLNLNNSELQAQIGIKDTEIAELRALLTDEHYQAMHIKEQITELRKQETKAMSDISTLEIKKKDLGGQVIELDDEILYQSFGLYKPLYDFANSTQYKERLEEVRQQQKEMIKSKTAVRSYSSWTVNGSKAQGNKMTNDNIKQILRCFNAECENVIDQVKFNNYVSMKSRIIRSFEALNKLNDVNMISIEQDYLDSKLEELSLAYEYQLKNTIEQFSLFLMIENL